ncbi:hypothetical protein [Pollutimonas harenae]|uniref:Uncharacterized protein n=1 Tax=Pollutimonas harenae TaxID=657015 RepID=A0A853GW50_9BURK|nr:hypothetical protein [Pollutimonas harenae]NYT84986.1 hypothetical protein [Pollutimonas harenae]TEA72624.1 hypothetical protein ERD84_01570 [Pollutimonas harenae]
MLALPAAAVDLETLADDPCLAVPGATVAELFGVPEAEIKQRELKMKRRLVCTTKWSGADNSLFTEVQIEIMDSQEKAAKRFKSRTRSVSREEMAKAAQILRDKLDAADKTNKSQKSDSAKRAENSIIGAASQTPIEYEDVDAMGDEARFDLSEGKLVARQGAAIITIEAYSGPDMPMPGNYDVKSILKADRTWRKDTMPARKQQTLQLAETLFKRLK